MKQIPIAGPWITQKEIDYVTDAVASNWYQNANDYLQRFENAFAQYHGMSYALALPSCTSAIHLSLLALDIKPGDEVIVPDVTWIGTAAPITYVGATPVFADIDVDTWCLSAKSFESCITPNTRAVIPVDLYGGMPDMNTIIEIARQHDIAVIEDAAESIGSAYQGKKAGSFGDVGVFSFHGSKTLTTGEGGMLVTNNEKICRRALLLRDHGRPPGDRMFYNQEVAYKYKMTSMQAALGLAQLERIEELVSKKRQIFQWYKNALSRLKGVTLNHESPALINSYWMVTIILDRTFGLEKKQLIESMSRKGIQCRPFFFPLSSLPAYAGYDQATLARRRNHISYEISPYGINLPSAMNMSEHDVLFVADALESILTANENP